MKFNLCESDMRSILITGGTGFLGRALVCRLLQMPEVERICIFSRDEAKQAAMRAQMADPHERLHWFIGDVRDQPRLRRAMSGVDVVIHAAALKRVEVGEYNPAEMVKTNVLGTMNVIDAAFDAPLGRAQRPRHVVYVSSDKACQPLNAYGASKLMGEKLILASNNVRGREGPIFSAVRYGNVAGSTGSVIPTWRERQRKNEEIIMTDPRATRFWMRIDQAVDFVLGVARMEKGGGPYVPRLPAYQLGDLAVAMGIVGAINMIGLQQGEKLHERMLEDRLTSAEVERMSVDDIRAELEKI